MYKLVVKPSADKNFSKIPKKFQEKVFKKLTLLEIDPFQSGIDVKKLTGSKKSYRLRVGELRVIYELDTDKKEIFVTDIDFRRTTSY